MKQNEKGFSAVETLLVLVVVGLIGVAGWYVWDNRIDDAKTATSQDTSEMKRPQVYERTTTVPKDWKTYTSDKQKFSISYPSAWEAQESGGTLAENSTAANKDYFSLGFRPDGPGPREIQYMLEVSHETLDEATQWLKQNATESQSEDSGVRLTVVSEKYFTYDEHRAVRIDTRADDGTAPDSYSSQIFVSANGLLYKFNTQFHDDYALKDKEVLGVFESLKIK